MLQNCKVKAEQSCPGAHHEGMEVQLHSFLNLAVGESEWSASRTSHSSSQQKSPYYPLNKKLGKPQSKSECFEVEKNLLTQPGVAT
jgi:hypothetical protein